MKETGKTIDGHPWLILACLGYFGYYFFFISWTFWTFWTSLYFGKGSGVGQLPKNKNNLNYI